MSNAVYRCKSCKTRVTLAMTICPICGEPISPQTALLSSGSSVPTPARVVTRHNTASAGPTASPAYVAPAPELPCIPQPAPEPAQSPTLQQMWDEMATPTTSASSASVAANGAAHPFSAPPARARAANRSFALYVACVVMVLVGSFLIGIGLARRYTASEQALQNSAAPAKVIVVQPSAGVGGPLPTEADTTTK